MVYCTVCIARARNPGSCVGRMFTVVLLQVPQLWLSISDLGSSLRPTPPQPSCNIPATPLQGGTVIASALLAPQLWLSRRRRRDALPLDATTVPDTTATLTQHCCHFFSGHHIHRIIPSSTTPVAVSFCPGWQRARVAGMHWSWRIAHCRPSSIFDGEQGLWQAALGRGMAIGGGRLQDWSGSFVHCQPATASDGEWG